MAAKKTILIADDEMVNQMVFDEILSEKYDVIFVNNGVQCLEMLHVHRPTLILMDVCMPEMDGLETCKNIKASAENN